MAFSGSSPCSSNRPSRTRSDGLLSPGQVHRLDIEPGEDRRLRDGLPLRADDAALDRLPRPERGDELVGRLAGLDLIGDDVVGVEPCPAGPAAGRASRWPISLRM